MSKEREALKLALEALETGKPMFDAYWGGSQFDNAITAIKEALAQPEQEPVAVVDANDDGYWADILPDRNVKIGQLLYTTSPQRTWVGLTKKEVYDLYDSDYAVFHQRIEAKLKEKNT